MMVRPVNENDFDRRFPKDLRRRQTAEAPANNHDPRRLRVPPVRTIDRIETSSVHPSLSQASEARNFRESSFQRGKSLGNPGCDPYIEQTKRNKEPRNAERHRL